MSTLQQRVHSYLRDKEPPIAEEQSETSAIKDLEDVLARAEEELRVVQARVDKLKQDLASLRS